MYDIIYQFLLDNIYNSTDLVDVSTEIMGLSLNLNEWLAHSTTIFSMFLIVFFAIWLIRWVFKLVGGLFILK